jgi:hypothetical protein
MILLDTNVVSAMRRRRTAPDPHVAAWLADQPFATNFMSVITVMEVERGIRRPARRDPRQAESLRQWYAQEVLRRFADRVLPVGIDVAQACAKLHAGRTLPELDALIAATALVHDLTLATRNVRDFAGTGVRLVNPWAYRVGTGSAPE